jgi:predicted nuclease of predicted toxin-antitoxin system
VRLLFDQNLAPRLVRDLADLFPDSVHVREVGLASANDSAVWAYAATNQLTIVSKDSDFRQRSFLFGAPPRVIWVRIGNARTADVAAAIRASRERILAFESDPEGALLVVS